MSIFLNNSEISSIKLGDTSVSKMFLGNEQVFPAPSPTPTPTPTLEVCPNSTSSVKMTGWVAGDRILSPIGYAPYGRETYTYGDETVRYETGVWFYIGAAGEIARAYSYAEWPWLVDWPSPYAGEKVRQDGTGCGSPVSTPTPTPTPSPTSTIPCVYGCTDSIATNYNLAATCDDGSCTYCVNGCMDPTATNYNPAATCDDGSCSYCVYGCMDNAATNYDPAATCDNGSCTYCVNGCTDLNACNYDPSATCDDGSCSGIKGCTDNTAVNYNSSATCDDGSCIPCVYGCTDPNANNYNPAATCDDYTCNGDFGSSGFKWMRIFNVDSATASGIGQNNITISVTQTGGGMFTLNGMHAAYLFPPEYGVPLSGNQIANTQAGVFTAVFSAPVADALIAFASVGAAGTPVSVQVLDADGNPKSFTPIWDSNSTVAGTQTTYLNEISPTQYTQFVGEEGFNIIQINGTMSSVTFNYGSAEYYCTVCFGFVDQNI